jgi:hypothetical protein
VAWLKFGFSDFLCGSFPALGGSKHGFLGVIAPRNASIWQGLRLFKTEHHA